MSSIEGGKFICYVHEFETADVDEWDKHCYEEEGHDLEVTQVCADCSETNKETIPYPEGYVRKSHTGGSSIVLKCPKCAGYSSNEEQ